MAKSNSKTLSSPNRNSSPKNSKLHLAECPIGGSASGLYNSNPNDSSSTDPEDKTPNISEIIHASSNTGSAMMGKTDLLTNAAPMFTLN